MKEKDKNLANEISLALTCNFDFDYIRSKTILMNL